MTRSTAEGLRIGLYVSLLAVVLLGIGVKIQVLYGIVRHALEEDASLNQLLALLVFLTSSK